MRTITLVYLPHRLVRRALGSVILRNPMMPGILAWVLLAAAHLISAGLSSPLTVPLAMTGAMFVLLAFVIRPFAIPLPFVPERDAQVFLLIALSIFALETLFAGGLPLFGSADYTEFGLPVLHHVVFSTWILPLVAPRRAGLYLAAVMAIALTMFSRQLMILALIAYLMRAGLRNVLPPMLVAFGIVALDSFRNSVLGVQEAVAQGGEFVSGPIGHLLFWIYLYVLGPYTVTFGAGSAGSAPIDILSYWNTLPDWALLTKMGMSNSMALAMFYPAVAMLVIFLTRLRSFETRTLGVCIHILSYVTFFSNTLLSTPVIGTFLLVAFLRRGQQIAMPADAECSEAAHAAARGRPDAAGL